MSGLGGLFPADPVPPSGGSAPSGPPSDPALPRQQPPASDPAMPPQPPPPTEAMPLPVNEPVAPTPVRRPSRIAKFWRRIWWLLVLPTLIISICLTALRWSQPEDALARWVSFAPYAVVGYSVVLLLCLWRSLFRRGRWWWLTLALLVSLPLGLHVWWLSPQSLGSNPPPADAAEGLVVMTLNAQFGQADATETVQAVASRDVDVLVVQEITPGFETRLNEAGLDKALPEKVGSAKAGVTGTMVYSKFTMSSPAPIATAFGSFRTTVSAPLGDVDLVATHPQPLLNPPGWLKDHKTLLASARGADLIVGDLNATPDHQVMMRMQQAGFFSAAERTNAGWRPTWPANQQRKALGLVPLPRMVQIDYVMVGPDWAATGYDQTAISYTDHLAVVATVSPK